MIFGGSIKRTVMESGLGLLISWLCHAGRIFTELRDAQLKTSGISLGPFC